MFKNNQKNILIVICVIVISSQVLAENKYSAKANQKTNEEINFRTLDKPFRMAKLNILWTKAQLRLTVPKLKSLYSDLKIQDKEEISYKRLKSEGMDKEGLKEAELRKKIITILKSYDLLEHFEDVSVKAKNDPAYNESTEKHINKSLFKDKKLNKLWMKAEMAGFTSEELQALKEEFTHHQDKIDEYHTLFNEIDAEKLYDIDNAMDKEEKDAFNEIGYNSQDGDNVAQKTEVIRKKHNDIKDNYDRLFRLSAQGPLNKEFVEPKVEQLWRIAMQSNFKPQELESLRIELTHYERRLLKLRELQVKHASTKDALDPKITGVKPSGLLEMEDTIKKQMRKVEKIHGDLEGKITGKHYEL